MSKYIGRVNNFAEALTLCYSSNEYEKILSQFIFLEDLIFGEGREDIKEVFLSRSVPLEIKHQAIDKLAGDLDTFVSNVLHILTDRRLIYYLRVFITSVKVRLEKSLKIQNIYIFSSYEIHDYQKKRLEEILTKQVAANKHNFIYDIDKSLQMGIKVQVNSVIDEYSIVSNLLNMKLKFESIYY